MKRLLSLILASIMCFALVGCSNNSSTFQTANANLSNLENIDDNKNYYVSFLDDETDKEKYGFSYLYRLNELNELKYNKYLEKGKIHVEIVGPLYAILDCRSDSYSKQSIRKSYITLFAKYIYTFSNDTNGHVVKYEIETTGMEDKIINWHPGDTIRVTGYISKKSEEKEEYDYERAQYVKKTNYYFDTSYIYMSDGEVTVENLSR